MQSPDHPPRSICILRLSALGDVTHVVPVIHALKEHWPCTQITWIIGAAEHHLLNTLPGVEFIVFDKHGGWREIRKLHHALKQRQFDILLHMQVAARANLVSRLIHASLRLGWDRLRSRDFHNWFTNATVAAVPFQHQVEGFLEFPRALGLNVSEPRWDIPIGLEAQNWARGWIDPSRPTLVISPCSSHVARNWRPEYYSMVADFAAARLDMQVILSGGPGKLDRTVGAAIESNMRESCLNLIGQDTLEQSKALFKQADLLISPDSGPAHIASALGTDVLGLYAATWSRRSGPYNSLNLCVDRFAEAARRYRKREPEQLRWGSRIETPGVMDLIRPNEVMERLASWRDVFESRPDSGE